MKVAIDARMLGWTGIGRYTGELIKNLAEIDRGNHYCLLVQPKDTAKLPALPDNFSVIAAAVRPYSLGEQIGLLRLLRQLKADLVHFPSFNAPVLYAGKTVYTIPDLTLVHYKTNRGNGPGRILFEFKYWAMRFALRHAIMKGLAFTTYCDTVKTELLRTFHRPGLQSLIKPTLLGPAVPPQTKPEPLPGTDSPFLLYVGNFYPNKNLGRLLEAFDKLRQYNKDLNMVIVGRADYFQDQLKRQAGKLGATANINFTGFVSDAQLLWLYKNASLFVFPSLSEGFGLPPLEAMAAGCPVISSNASCMPEVLGEAAAYFDPLDPSDMAAKIEALLNDPAELERLRKAGLEQVKKYSWRRMAEETLAVYKKVLGE